MLSWKMFPPAGTACNSPVRTEGSGQNATSEQCRFLMVRLRPTVVFPAVMTENRERRSGKYNSRRLLYCVRGCFSADASPARDVREAGG